MAVTLLGSSAVARLLDGVGRVTIVNQTAAEDDATIVAFAIVRHLPGGDRQRDVAFDLEIGADQSVSVEAVPPLDAAPEAVEVTLRLRLGDQSEIVDAYAVSRAPAGGGNGQAEFGMKPTGEEVVDGEDTVPGFAEFTVYALPAG
jgi:hypothetical protein